jgi:predicted PurR-regulated permease PerM
MPGEPTLPDSETDLATTRLAPMTAARAARITAAAIAVIAMAFALWYSRTAILLAFAGILLAIVLYGASRALSELTNIPRLAMLALVAVSLALGLVLLAWTAGPTLTQQIAQLAQRIAAGASTLTKELASFAEGTSLFENVDLFQLLGKFMSPWGIATGATSVALSVFGLFSAAHRDVFRRLLRRGPAHLYPLCRAVPASRAAG